MYKRCALYGTTIATRKSTDFWGSTAVSLDCESKSAMPLDSRCFSRKTPACVHFIRCASVPCLEDVVIKGGSLFSTHIHTLQHWKPPRSWETLHCSSVFLWLLRIHTHRAQLRDLTLFICILVTSWAALSARPPLHSLCTISSHLPNKNTHHMQGGRPLLLSCTDEITPDNSQASHLPCLCVRYGPQKQQFHLQSNCSGSVIAL